MLPAPFVDVDDNNVYSCAYVTNLFIVNILTPVSTNSPIFLTPITPDFKQLNAYTKVMT